MLDISALIQQGSTNILIFIPSAILLGALHGLEPGHSKTMMAAFIIAVKGTVGQAVLLGLAATISHTAIVWIIALAGLHFGSQFNTDATEPYLQLVSAALIISIAIWMIWRTWQENLYRSRSSHHHAHEELRTIDTGHGVVTAEIFEDGVPPCWRVRFVSGEKFNENEVSIEIVRANGTNQTFDFFQNGDFLQSLVPIPEPHLFKATLKLAHGSHEHSYHMEFNEHHHHSHDEVNGHSTASEEYEDAHQRAHAEDIQKRFANRTNVTTSQIMMFGLTGGLIPCPASITVLLICLQLKQFTLGAMLVLCFSIGLAVTMVTVGAVAALGVNHVSKRWSGFDAIAQRAPYLSIALIILVGFYTGYIGWIGLSAL